MRVKDQTKLTFDWTLCLDQPLFQALGGFPELT